MCGFPSLPIPFSMMQDRPEAELAPGIALLGQVDEQVFDIYDTYEPLESGSNDNCYISKVTH